MSNAELAAWAAYATESQVPNTDDTDDSYDEEEHHDDDKDSKILLDLGFYLRTFDTTVFSARS